MSLRGLGTALITPFKADKSIDFEALQRLLDKQIQGGVDFIVVLGTTGEAATLSESEKAQVRTFVRDYITSNPLNSNPLIPKLV